MKSNARRALHIAIAIAVALVIWMVVDYDRSETVSNRPTKIVENVPVEFTGENSALASRGLMRIADEETPTVTLTLRGKRWDLAKLDTSNVRAVVDLSSITSVGTQAMTYRVDFQNSKLSNLITVSEQAPSTVSVTVGELYRKPVDIRVEVTGDVAREFIAGEPVVDPETLELWGKRSEVMLVDYAQVTLNISNANATVVELLEYELYNHNGQRIDNPNIHANTDTIQVTLPVELQKELPLRVIFEEADGVRVENVDYQISPASVLMVGDAGTLGAADSLLLGTIALGDLEGDKTFSFPIIPPKGCVNDSGETEAIVTVRFKDLTTRAITTANLQYENAPEGKTITILSSGLTVTLRGTEGDLTSILPEDITVMADLSQVENASGNYTVPAKITVTNGADVGIIGTYQMKVGIEDEQPAEEPVEDVEE